MACPHTGTIAFCDACDAEHSRKIAAEEPDYLVEAMLIARGEMRVPWISMKHLEALHAEISRQTNIRRRVATLALEEFGRISYREKANAEVLACLEMGTK